MMKGKVAIITGAAQGIGKSIAILFAEEKMNVVVADIKKGLARVYHPRVESLCLGES